MRDIVYKHSAGGLIFKDGQVLLINWEPPRSTFDFPKGTIEPGESAEAACLREVFEETGYRTTIHAYIGQTHYEYDWEDGTHHDKIVDYYILQPTHDPAVQPEREPHETFENSWQPIDRALELLTKEIDKQILRKAIILHSHAKHEHVPAE